MIAGGCVWSATVRVVVMSIIALTDVSTASIAPGASRAAATAAVPDLILQRRRPRQGRPRGGHVGKRRVHRESLVDVPPEEVPQGRLGRGGQQIDPQIRGADRVGLLHDEVPARVETRRGSGEGEGDEKPHQAEDGAVHGAEPRGPRVVRARAAAADAKTDLLGREQCGEQRRRDEGRVLGERHRGRSYPGAGSEPSMRIRKTARAVSPGATTRRPRPLDEGIGRRRHRLEGGELLSGRRIDLRIPIALEHLDRDAAAGTGQGEHRPVRLERESVVESPLLRGARPRRRPPLRRHPESRGRRGRGASSRAARSAMRSVPRRARRDTDGNRRPPARQSPRTRGAPPRWSTLRDRGRSSSPAGGGTERRRAGRPPRRAPRRPSTDRPRPRATAGATRALRGSEGPGRRSAGGDSSARERPRAPRLDIAIRRDGSPTDAGAESRPWTPSPPHPRGPRRGGGSPCRGPGAKRRASRGPGGRPRRGPPPRDVPPRPRKSTRSRPRYGSPLTRPSRPSGARAWTSPS